MAKSRIAYQCRACGALSPRWQGQCPQCNEWNTFEAQGAAPAKALLGRRDATHKPERTPSETVDVRWGSGSAELDRVLGGGLVPGSVTLIGGEPGIGKSTLLLQAAASLAADHSVVYASGEELSLIHI